MLSGKVLPAGFALLPNKEKPTYKAMWTKIYQAVNGYHPNTLILDMEPAAAKTFIVVFGVVEIVYCYFHLPKALREQLGKKHCIKDICGCTIFNKIYQLVASLPFVPAHDIVNVVTSVLEPIIDNAEEELSENALDWCDYVVNTYIGCVNPRTGRRKQAKIASDDWSQFQTLLDNKPYTTNSVEGFNSAWNGSSVLNATVWACIDHLRREEGLAMAKWREETMATAPRLPSTEDPGSKRIIAQHNKIAKLRNLCAQYYNFGPNMRGEYLALISAVLED